MFNKAIGLQPEAAICSCTTKTYACVTDHGCAALGMSGWYVQYLDCSTHELCGETYSSCIDYSYC